MERQIVDTLDEPNNEIWLTVREYVETVMELQGEQRDIENKYFMLEDEGGLTRVNLLGSTMNALRIYGLYMRE